MYHARTRYSRGVDEMTVGEKQKIDRTTLHVSPPAPNKFEMHCKNHYADLRAHCMGMK